MLQVDYVDGEDYRLFDPQVGSGRLVVTYTFYPDRRYAQMRMATLVPSSDDLTQAKFATQSDWVLAPTATQVLRLTTATLTAQRLELNAFLPSCVSVYVCSKSWCGSACEATAWSHRTTWSSTRRTGVPSSCRPT